MDWLGGGVTGTPGVAIVTPKLEFFLCAKSLSFCEWKLLKCCLHSLGQLLAAGCWHMASAAAGKIAMDIQYPTMSYILLLIECKIAMDTTYYYVLLLIE